LVLPSSAPAYADEAAATGADGMISILVGRG